MRIRKEASKQSKEHEEMKCGKKVDEQRKNQLVKLLEKKSQQNKNNLFEQPKDIALSRFQPEAECLKSQPLESYQQPSDRNCMRRQRFSDKSVCNTTTTTNGNGNYITKIKTDTKVIKCIFT